jgi:hypothetical protein
MTNSTVCGGSGHGLIRGTIPASTFREPLIEGDGGTPGLALTLSGNCLARVALRRDQLNSKH